MEKEMVMLGSGPTTGVDCFGPIEKHFDCKRDSDKDFPGQDGDD